ncbi:MAG: TIM barrel protein [Sedimentisphaerales bacterium]
MSNYSRRDFIKTSGSVLGGAALSGLTLNCHKNEAVPGKWTGFKYAMCNESMAELSWAEQCRIVSDVGYEGIEIAAFTLVEEGVQEIGPTGRKEIVSVMKDAGLECVGLHWLLAPPPKGLHFTTPDAGIRRKTVTYLDALIDFCGDLGGSYMIFGSPKQRDTKGISIEQAKKYFAEGLTAVADHAQQRGIEVLVEPLGKRTTDVVNTLAEASQLAEQVNRQAIGMMFDFNNTVDETEPFDLLLRKYHKNIHHVHVQEMGGKHLGTGTAVNDYVKAFQVLKDMRYNHWISLEVFDFSPGGRTIAEESMNTLKQIEGKLI